MWHIKSKKKPTGGKLGRFRKKKKYERGMDFLGVRTGETRKKIITVRGGNIKVRLLAANIANVSDPKTGKVRKVKIEGVIENKANPHFARRNIITKGAIIKTEIGNAKVTNRPSQHGVVNAVLLEEGKS